VAKWFGFAMLWGGTGSSARARSSLRPKSPRDDRP